MERLSNRLLFKYKLVEKEIEEPIEIQEKVEVVSKKKKKEKDDLEDLARHFNKEANQGSEESGDDSDEFGVFDPNKHVSFDEKVKFADQLKKASRDQLTELIRVLNTEQKDSVEDLGSDKLQLRIDCIELDAYLKC